MKSIIGLLLLVLSIVFSMSTPVLAQSSEQKKCDALEQEMDSEELVNLGGAYLIGEGVYQNYEKAFFCFELSANRGNERAQFYLATLYDTGDGTEKNLEKAFFWYKKAAEQGDVDSQLSLGDMYNSGEGVTQNYNRAHFWYIKAAKQGDVEAYAALGDLYYYGNGVPRKYHEAYALYYVAKKNGLKSKTNVFEELESKLSQKEMREAKILIKKYSAEIKNTIFDTK